MHLLGNQTAGRQMRYLQSINVTSGKEFDVAAEIRSKGLMAWVPLQLSSCVPRGTRQVKWYDRPYTPKLIFGIIPPIYYTDVKKLKHVIGDMVEFSPVDVRGIPEHTGPTGKLVRARYGFNDFYQAVMAEYADACRKRDNAGWVCQFEPGQALTILAGLFEGRDAVFQSAVKHAHDDYHKLRVEVEVMGGMRPVEIDPDAAEAKV